MIEQIDQEPEQASPRGKSPRSKPSRSLARLHEKKDWKEIGRVIALQIEKYYRSQENNQTTGASTGGFEISCIGLSNNSRKRDFRQKTLAAHFKPFIAQNTGIRDITRNEESKDSLFGKILPALDRHFFQEGITREEFNSVYWQILLGVDHEQNLNGKIMCFVYENQQD